MTDFGQLSADFSPFLGRGEAPGGPKWVNWWPRPPRGPNSRSTGPISKILTVLEMALLAGQSHPLKGLKNAVKAPTQKKSYSAKLDPRGCYIPLKNRIGQGMKTN